MFKPGKGVRVALDRDIAPFLEDAMSELNEATYNHVYTDMNALETLCNNYDWNDQNDQYGDKAVKVEDLANGNQLRVTLIIDPKGELKLDIREWYVADDE